MRFFNIDQCLRFKNSSHVYNDNMYVFPSIVWNNLIYMQLKINDCKKRGFGFGGPLYWIVILWTSLGFGTKHW
jgi:hypothetical protein